MIALLLAGCAPTPAWSPAGVEVVEAIPGVGDLSADLFDLGWVHTVDITLPQEGLRDLRDHPWDYTQGAVVIDGVSFDEVGVRLKGAGGSFQPISQKSNFKVDLNRYVSGQTYLGVEQLTLNNMVVDCSYLREWLAYEVIAQAGLPRTRTSYVQVTVNGELYGLYVQLETPDDVWLDRVFEEPDGNLYDGKYVFEEDWSWYSRVDFTQREQQYFQLEEGDDVGLVDIYGVTEALNTRGGADVMSSTGDLLDWEQILRVFAVETWIGQNDGYFLNGNNYRVYFNPATGLMEMLAWDTDYAFLDDRDWGMDWYRPYGRISDECFDAPGCRDRLEALRVEVADHMDTLDLRGHLEDIVDVIGPYTLDDPRGHCNGPRIGPQQDWLRDWVRQRSDDIRRGRI